MEKLLTISVAAYNVEMFIKEALESLLRVDNKEILEIFVIDDGGSDSTLSIAKKFEKRFPGIVYAIHKENGGYGTTVNWSLEHASGKYFKLLDGDDWFDEHGLNHLLEILEQKKYDVVITPHFEGEDINNMKLMLRDWSCKFGKELELSELGNSQIPMPCITFKTEVLRNSKLKLPSRLFYTDYLYNVIPFSYANTIYFDSTPVYCYRMAREGQSIGVNSRINHFTDAEQISIELCDFANQYKDKDGSNFFAYRAAGICKFTLVSLLFRPTNKESLEMIKKYEKKIKSNYPDVFGKMTELGRFGVLIKVLRRSNYFCYKIVSAITKKYL